FQLSASTPGTLSSLTLHTTSRLPPGHGEVEIEVEACGINFKDVMLAMGIIGADAVEDGYLNTINPGLECAGRISAVGEGVKQFRVGDKVLALGRNCLSSFTITDASFVIHKPDALTFEEAATIPVIFLTASYTLQHQAKVRPGDRVLIHGA